MRWLFWLGSLVALGVPSLNAQPNNPPPAEVAAPTANILPSIGALSLLVALATALIYVAIYAAQLRQLRLTSNERFMTLVIEIDKMIIADPTLAELYWPTPDSYSLNNIPPKIKAFIYMHINMFDVVFNYYVRSLRAGWVHRKIALRREEMDNWAGWQSYMKWLITKRMDSEQFFIEAADWFSPDFVTFLQSIAVREKPKPARSTGMMRLAGLVQKETEVMWSDVWEGTKDLGRDLKFWEWQRVRYANIPQDARNNFEQFGENVFAHALASGQHSAAYPELGPLQSDDKYRANLRKWLIERRDLAERREQRLETFEAAILIFVFLEVLRDYILAPLFLAFR
jgi:hypothetical protein